MQKKTSGSGSRFEEVLTFFRVNVQGVKSLGGPFACLSWEFNFYEVKRIYFCSNISKRKGI